MGFVVLAVLCSVAVSVLLRWARDARVDVPQAVTWNYLAATLLCALLLQPVPAEVFAPAAPWGGWLALGVLLPTLFVLLGRSVQRAGIVRTDIAQRLSLLLSLLAAFTLFGERANGLRLLGLGLGLLALPCLLARPRHARGGASAAGQWLPLTVLVGFAAVDVLLKRIALDGTPLAVSLLATFAIAFLPMLGWQLLRHARGQAALTLRNAWAGLLLGVLNFGNIYFYLRAHRALSDHPSLVFASMNVGVVLLGTLVGVAVYRERLSRLNLAAIPMAVAAIVLIGLGAE
ncbi:MAG: EamA/RhaT family transporter [Pseudoxanthomonas sp.]